MEHFLKGSAPNFNLCLLWRHDLNELNDWAHTNVFDEKLMAVSYFRMYVLITHIMISDH